MVEGVLIQLEELQNRQQEKEFQLILWSFFRKYDTKINTYHDLAKCNNGDILYFVHLPNAAVNLHQTIHYAIFCNVNNAGVQKNVIGINGLADLSFSPTAYHGVVASVISPGNFNGVGQVIYDTVAFPNILGELYVIDYELIQE